MNKLRSLWEKHLALWLLSIWLCGCSTLVPMENTGPVPEQVVIPLHFATDRAAQYPINDTDDFGGDRGTLRYGMVNVRLALADMPQSGMSDWRRWAARAADNMRNRSSASLTLTPEFHYQPQLYYGLTAPQQRTALVYIHGFGRTFEEVAEHMATMIFEMDFRGVPILYSWPTDGHTRSYLEDSGDADWSGANLEKFLTALLNHPDIDTVHLIAHSMGNRALLKAMTNLVLVRNTAALWQDGEIVLMAPDVDAQIFARDYAHLFGQLNPDTTLYVSEDDVPLKASSMVNDNPRLGDASNQVPVFEGIETIDTSEALTFLSAHSSYRKNGAVQRDLHLLINQRLPAAQRPTLKPVSDQFRTYWRLQQQD